MLVQFVGSHVLPAPNRSHGTHPMKDVANKLA
jgi:hypothetical protein